MKRCSTCGREYPDSVSFCKDGTLLAGSAHDAANQRIGSTGQTIISDKPHARRNPPYLALFGILALITIFSISYPYLKEELRRTASQFSGRFRPTSPTFGARDAAMAMLNGWAASTNAHDLNAHMNYYADSLTVYYNHQNVSRDFVRSTRTPAFAKYKTLNVQLSNIQIMLDPGENSATATFTKTWDFNGARHSNGSTQQRILLSKLSGHWLISGEEDLKINYANW
jgi:ketosteroid isomerase-like protein